MEAAAAAGRGASLSQSTSQLPSRKQWRAVSEQSVRSSGTEDLERSKLGQSDERTIYEQGQEPIDGVDFCSIQMDGIMGMEDGILQQRIHSLARQREEMQQMEIELRAQLIAKSEIVEMQNSFDARFKEQDNVVARLQEQLHERDQSMRELERKIEEKDRELHAVRLDNEAAWAKEDLLREQNQEIANFRRERDKIEAERAHHRQQIHDLQEHIQDKERQMLELQEQHRVAQETILYKDEQIRDAQTWIARVQEIDALQSSTLQAELRERTEQYNQLWLGCQRQFAEMERVHVQAIQQLQLELAGVRGNSGTYSAESQNTSSDSSQVVPNSGTRVEANGGGASNSSGGLPNGNSDNSQSYVSSGNASSQTNHAPSLPLTPSIMGMPSYHPPGQVTAMHPYIMHQQGTNHNVASQVPQSHVGHFQSVPALNSLQQWQNQQAVSEGHSINSQNQYSLSQAEENPSRSDSTYGYEYSVNGQSLHPDYLNAHLSQGVDPNCQITSNEVAQTLESVEKSFFVGPDTQHSLQQISSHFQEALRLDPLNQTSEIKTEDNDAGNIISNNGTEMHNVVTEQPCSAVEQSPSESSAHTVPFAEATVNNADDVASTESYVSTDQSNGLSTRKISESPLLDERALLACIVRTIPAGGKIRISSTLPNRLGKMLAPLHWHDYKRKYGKLDDFVSIHPELFLIEGDYIQLREGAQGIIAATAAVAKVAAAAAASSPYSSFFPPVAVTPMADAGRVKKLSSLEPKPLRNSVDSSHSPAMQSRHSNGSGYISGSLSNVKILSKSKDSLERNGHEARSGQPLTVPAENGVHSDRSILGNPQNQVPIHARGGSAKFYR
ncbi:uncharacterized protein LOC110728013 isoform X2 [Chenopodium quinoa]|uniref:uncharacterized protein LOC110728013 isoform X2 n=1 Tax=Chenopodium quinoa TaxID=63459 RepID=UPI000B79A9F2|nr:uncharacterized protein LOC110728013 isoform X2 [Chenopodium quinoa]